MAGQERARRIGHTGLAVSIWQEIQDRSPLHHKPDFHTPNTYKRQMLARILDSGFLELYVRSSDGSRFIRLNTKPESISPIQLFHQIIDHLLLHQPHLKQAVEYYVATQTVIGSLHDVPHAWTDPNGIARLAANKYYELAQENFGHSTPLHQFIISNIYSISELFTVIQDLNNQLGNGKDPIISAIVHAIASPLSTIKNGFFFRDRGVESHNSAYRSFVSGSLSVFDLFEKLILYTNGEEAFSGDLGQIVRIVSHDSLLIECNITTELKSYLDPKIKLEIYLVIQELIHNAIKYSTQTGPLLEERTILVREEMPNNEDDHWVLTISNMSSRGVSLSEQGALFESGFRENGQTQIHGTGYGLFMVKSIVEKLGGTIQFVDPLDGFATTIRLTLPAKLINLQNSHPSSPEAPANPT